MLVESIPGEYRKAFVFSFNYIFLDEHVMPYSLLHIYTLEQTML